MKYTTLKIFCGYLLILLLLIIGGSVQAQSPCGGDNLCVVQFNAGFNEANKVTWLDKLNECDTKFIDIQTDAAAAGKFKIVALDVLSLVQRAMFRINVKILHLCLPEFLLYVNQGLALRFLRV